MLRQSLCAAPGGDGAGADRRLPVRRRRTETRGAEIRAGIRKCAGKAGERGEALRLWISAISCRGALRLSESAIKLCKQIYVIPRGCRELLKPAVREAADRGLRVIACPEVLDPESLEAVLLPEAGICYTVERGEPGKQRDALAPAVEALREAKALHDELEAVSRPYMDFDALTAFTEETLARLFS